MSTPAWNDDAAWKARAAEELAELAAQCSRCGICGDYLPPRSYNGHRAYESNDGLKKCRCCSFCHERAFTDANNYHGRECVSAANHTIGFRTEEQRKQAYKSVLDFVVAHGMKGRPCRACCAYFKF